MWGCGFCFFDLWENLVLYIKSNFEYGNGESEREEADNLSESGLFCCVWGIDGVHLKGRFFRVR